MARVTKKKRTGTMAEGPCGAQESAAGSNKPSLDGLCLLCREEGQAVLKCKRHCLCHQCAVKRTVQVGVNDMFSCPAEECSRVDATSLPLSPPPLTANSAPPIEVFVDNSNVWIEAMKLGSKLKNFNRKQDHRVRINYGPLTDVVARGRRSKGTLYGSEPPKVDAVWKKIKEREWRIDISQKSTRGKEKEVDSKIITDMLTLTLDPSHRPSTVVLISGDRDMLPAVKRILEEAQSWKIEIYIWEDVLSHKVKELEDMYENLSIVPLNKYWEVVVYYEYKFRFSDIPKSWSIILTLEPGAFSTDKQLNQTHPIWWKKLEKIARWPVQYRWMDNEARHLLLVFKGLEDRGMRALAERLNNPEAEEFRLPHVQRCVMYTEYEQRLKKKTKFVTDEEGWTTVVKRQLPNPTSQSGTKSNPTSQSGAQPIPPTLAQKPICSQKCCSGKNCEEGIKCKFVHSKSDKEYFGSRKDGKGNALRKTRLCSEYPNCQRPDVRCNFAHSEEDGWCLNCHHQGHFSKNCLNAACTHPKHV